MSLTLLLPHTPALARPHTPYPTPLMQLSRSFLNNLLLFVFFFTIFGAIGREMLSYVAPPPQNTTPLRR